MAAIAATAFVLQIVLGFTGMPLWALRWVAYDKEELAGQPDYLVVLGGGGIPSESGLIRTYYAAKIGRSFTGTTFIVSLPCIGDPATNSVGRMRDELVMRGIPKSAIRMEYDSYNTHEQAVAIARMLGAEKLDRPVLLVSSPVHVRRALGCFRKAGLTQVSCIPAYNVGAEADFGNKTLVGLRYAFWANLEAEIKWVREVIAMLYYKSRGWI